MAEKNLLKLLRAELADCVRIKEQLPSARLSTFSLGGDLDVLLEPLSAEGLSKAVKILASRDIPWKTLGAGSNIVLPDEGVEEPVIRLGKELSRVLAFDCVRKTDKELLKQLFCSDTESLAQTTEASGGVRRFFVEGAAPLMTLSRKLCQGAFSGLEFAAGIPGSLGGAVRMNAGAHSHSISEIVERIVMVDGSGEFRVLSKEELSFSYRHSALSEKDTVLAAELLLRVDSKEEILERRSSCLEYRKRTQPLSFPSAGSVFRNPSRSTGGLALGESACGEGELPSAGWLVEHVGLKGEKRGGVAYSELHANWLIKVDSCARAGDVAGLIEEAQRRVREEYGFELQTEILLW